MSNMNEVRQKLKFVRSALYVPASNARALEKARGLAADMLILDLEDAVAGEAKADARRAVLAFISQECSGKVIAVRINSPDSAFYDDDIKLLGRSNADVLVLPKVGSVKQLERVSQDTKTPLLAMIESPPCLYNARDIAAHAQVAGLIAGTNDIAAACGIRPGPERQGLELSLQMIVLAASACAKPCFDGVYNRLDDVSALEAECRQGRCFGFTGKTVIHPSHIATANAVFAPDAAEVEEANALLEQAKAGAQRFRGRMIETMHVEEARLTMERASRAVDGENIVEVA